MKTRRITLSVAKIQYSEDVDPVAVLEDFEATNGQIPYCKIRKDCMIVIGSDRKIALLDRVVQAHHLSVVASNEDHINE